MMNMTRNHKVDKDLCINKEMENENGQVKDGNEEQG